VTVPTVTNWFEALFTGVAAGLITLLSFIPALIGAILLLVIGWILSGWIARVITLLLSRIGFNTAADRTGVTGFMRQSGLQAQHQNAAWVMGEIVKWFIRLIFIELAAQALQLQAISTLLNGIVLWIPNLVVAIVILMVAALVARFMADIVRGAAAQGGLGNPGLLATLTQGAILGFAVLVALHQIGIAPDLIRILFAAIVGAIAVAFALAFGLGGRDVAAQITQGWYEQRGQAGQLFEGASRQVTAGGASTTATTSTDEPSPAARTRPRGRET
jgi:hypothetical protein